MYSRRELKQTAKSDLRGNWFMPIMITILTQLVNIPNTLDSIVFRHNNMNHLALSWGTVLIEIILSMWICTIYLNIVRKSDMRVGEIFFRGNGKYFLKFIAIYFLYTLFISLACLLLIVPGIILAYSYSQWMFIYTDNPEIGMLECLKTSRRMMKGHKWQLFVLGISFFWWGLLCLVTLGLAGLYVTPYMMTSHLEYYLYLTGELSFERENENLHIYR